MIKTLRITSVIAVILAAGFLVAPFFFGSRSDPKAEEFLKSVDAAEKFSKTHNQQSTKTDAQVSPLVRQAQTFALFLNPPKPEPKPEDQQETEAIRPVTVTPKFTLIGTSIFPNHPEKSLALIDEPGKGLHWVRQNSKIEHLTIKEVKSGVVIVSDGPRTSEIVAERPEKVSLLRNPPSHDVLTPVPSGAVPEAQPPADQAPPMPEVEIPMEKISQELAALEEQVNAGTLDPNVAAEKSSAIMEKYTAEVEAQRSRISKEESQNLNRLGSQLQAQKDGNSTKTDVLPHPEQAKRAEVSPKSPKLQRQQSIATKPESKSKDTTPSKPVPRQRDPRRRRTSRTGTTTVTPPPDKPTTP